MTARFPRINKIRAVIDRAYKAIPTFCNSLNSTTALAIHIP
jgi:hypothetical protein